MRNYGPEIRRRAGGVAVALALINAACAQPVLADDDAAANSEAEATPPTSALYTIWAGVYTAAQAERGKVAYTGPCNNCHGAKLDGAADDPDMPATPPLAGAKFLRDWNGRTLAALYEYTRATMPANNPGYLSAQEFADIVAYMLLRSGTPPGDDELEPDIRRLATIVIRQRP